MIAISLVTAVPTPTPPPLCVCGVCVYMRAHAYVHSVQQLGVEVHFTDAPMCNENMWNVRRPLQRPLAANEWERGRGGTAASTSSWKQREELGSPSVFQRALSHAWQRERPVIVGLPQAPRLPLSGGRASKRPHSNPPPPPPLPHPKYTVTLLYLLPGWFWKQAFNSVLNLTMPT